MSIHKMLIRIMKDLCCRMKVVQSLQSTHKKTDTLTACSQMAQYVAQYCAPDSLSCIIWFDICFYANINQVAHCHSGYCCQRKRIPMQDNWIEIIVYKSHNCILLYSVWRRINIYIITKLNIGSTNQLYNLYSCSAALANSAHCARNAT